MQRVADHYGIKLDYLLGPLRRQRYLPARRTIYWGLRELFQMSYPEIGRVMQGRHHTTVMHGVREAREAEKQVASMRVIKAVDDAVCE